MVTRRGQNVSSQSESTCGNQLLIRLCSDYGYVKRGLKSRHIQFIALGGTIGTGLFLGIGKFK